MILLSFAICVALIGFTTDAAPAPTGKALEGITLDEVLTGRFSAVGFNGTWISGNEFYYPAAGGVNIYNVATGVSSNIIPSGVLTSLRASSYRFSPDRTFILYSFDDISLYRHSSRARFSVYNLLTSTSYPLQPQPADPQSLLNYAAWAKGNSLVYVYENDIYYRSAPDAASDARLTNNGDAETFFNGIPDWVYEEEVLGEDNAMWFSSGRDKMVFASFDDRPVDTIQYSQYGEPSDMKYQYPTTISIRYPKAGRPNPLVSLTGVDMTSAVPQVSSLSFAPPAELVDQDHYFITAIWTKSDEVYIPWMNRHQNVSYLVFCNSTTSACRTEQTLIEPNGWVDLDSPPEFSSDGQRYLIILPVSQGAMGNFKHLVLHNRNSATSQPLTQGLWEVTAILGWDETGNVAYISGTAVDMPAARQLYKVNTATAEINCLTCGTVNADNQECLYNSITFSSDLSYYVHRCNGPHVPRSVIKETRTNAEVYLISDNTDLSNRLALKAVPSRVDLAVPLGGNYNARVQLMLPPSLNTSESTKYPMLVYVYGGPKSQQVTYSYRVDWGVHMASSRGVIYARIDGRGSGYQGDSLLQEIYRRMGTVEIEDQIKVAKYLKDTYSYIDPDRMAIWGWSYGGYATSSALAMDTENVFQCGVSVAPVTNWIYYDSIYTERYMGLPTAEDNLASYMSSDVCSKVENFRNKKFHLVHGSADDNVHYQQSMMLSKALEQADILFHQQTYPDENHSIGNFQKHLYHSLSKFMMTDCFQLENETWG